MVINILPFLLFPLSLLVFLFPFFPKQFYPPNDRDGGGRGLNGKDPGISSRLGSQVSTAKFCLKLEIRSLAETDADIGVFLNSINKHKFTEGI